MYKLILTVRTTDDWRGRDQMSGVGGEHADHIGSVGSGSSPVGIDQKENLLKVWNMKKQGKIRENAWSAEQTVGSGREHEPNPCSHR